jgi:hypothetical protein
MKPDVVRRAMFSADGVFRYHLSRVWDLARPPLCFVMLNPSTADGEKDDPTVRKCVGFAQRLGFGAIDVVNLFDFRATDPAALRSAGFPISPANDWWIQFAALVAFKGGGKVVCAWGMQASGLSRPAAVLDLLRAVDIQPHVLARCGDGTPAHPLMLPYSSKLEPMWQSTGDSR